MKDIMDIDHLPEESQTFRGFTEEPLRVVENYGESMKRKEQLLLRRNHSMEDVQKCIHIKGISKPLS